MLHVRSLPILAPMNIARAAAAPLLSADEPAAFTIDNRDGAAAFVLTCDHASRRIPQSLGTLGLSECELVTHIAWDIGAAAVARSLAQQLDAPLILQNYSRLVIDCNRQVDARDSIALSSDSVRIPGNEALDDTAVEARRAEIFHPYHDALRSMLEQRERLGRQTIVIAVHSFTPVMRGAARPWHAGLMYRRSFFAPLLLQTLRQNTHLRIGDNEPYGISDGIDYSIPHHCESRGIAHAGLELRQDLIAETSGQREWSTLLSAALREAAALYTQLP